MHKPESCVGSTFRQNTVSPGVRKGYYSYQNMHFYTHGKHMNMYDSHIYNSNIFTIISNFFAVYKATVRKVE